ncbi:MAG TPA: CAP domain-containing protein [Leptospiraceae bacterium]|nr:CAP domain-containing protein [Leptospiraceae bacterium]
MKHYIRFFLFSIALIISVTDFSNGLLAEPDAGTKANLIQTHNTFRKKHGVPDLKWNDSIAKYAQEWADNLAKKDLNLEHRQNNKYGENIFVATSRLRNLASATWYSEINLYDFNKPGSSSKAGHFTQLVWKSTTEFGCGVAKSKSDRSFFVCNYNPPGNIEGTFAANVFKPESAKRKSGTAKAKDLAKGIKISGSPESNMMIQIFGFDTCSSTNALKKNLDKQKTQYKFRDMGRNSGEYDYMQSLLEQSGFGDWDNIISPVVVYKQTVYMNPSIHQLK